MTTKSLVQTTVIALCCWLALLALVTRYSNTAPSVKVLFPSLSLIAQLPPVSILNKNRWSITLQSRDPDLVKDLYLKGAWLVLPSGLQGCLPIGAA